MMIPHFSTKLFDYDHSTKNFSADMSMLDEGGRREVFGLIYDDACDEGFYLVSHTSGERMGFVVDHIYMDDDNVGIRKWTLSPINQRLFDMGIRVTIFNT